MIRRLGTVAAFLILTTLVILGTMTILAQARWNVLLTRLPDVPGLGNGREVLKQQIAARDAAVRQRLNQPFGKADFAERTGTLGRIYQANQFYDRALQCYRLAVEYDDASPLWLYLSASVHQQRGQTEAMIGLLKHTLDLSSAYAPAVLKLADSYFKADQTHQARVYYERRLQLVPGDPYALMGLARIAMDQGQWDLAETHLKRAILSDPEFGDAHRLMAEVHEHHHRIDEMNRSLERAGQCPRFHPAPDPWVDDLQDLCYDPEQLLVLGSMALSRLDIQTAIEKHFTRALKIDPEDPAANLAMGKAWFMAGEWSRAYRYLIRTIELDPASDQAYFHLGLIMRKNGNLQEGERLFFKALEFQPDNPNVHNNLGVVFLEQGVYPRAIQSFQRALDIYPEHLEALYNLGMALWASGDTRAAVAQYQHVLAMKPGWRVPANSLAWILATDRAETIRNGEEALKWAWIACEGEGKYNPEFLDTLAAAFARAGRFKEAEQTALQAVTLARQSGDEGLAKEIEQRRILYHSGSAFSE